MIPAELEATILRLYHAEKWRPGTIAAQLGVHRDTVKRVLATSGAERASLWRNSRLLPFVALIEETLRRYPTLPASRLYEMCRERGHVGSPDHFRHFVALYRPRPPAEAHLRLSTLPGEQAQVDWAHFGSLRIGFGSTGPARLRDGAVLGAPAPAAGASGGGHNVGSGCWTFAARRQPPHLPVSRAASHREDASARR